MQIDDPRLDRILAALFDESRWRTLFHDSGVTGNEICDYALGIGLIRGDEMHGDCEIADAITRLCHRWDEWAELTQVCGVLPGQG